MLLRLVSAVQMWHSKTPISVLNCLLSKHLVIETVHVCNGKKHELSRGYF